MFDFRRIFPAGMMHFPSTTSSMNGGAGSADGHGSRVVVRGRNGAEEKKRTRGKVAAVQWIANASLQTKTHTTPCTQMQTLISASCTQVRRSHCSGMPGKHRKSHSRRYRELPRSPRPSRGPFRTCAATCASPRGNPSPPAPRARRTSCSAWSG